MEHKNNENNFSPGHQANDIWPYIGTDSTSVTEIEILEAEDSPESQNVEAVNLWLERSVKANTKEDVDAEIMSGIELGRAETAGYHRLIHATAKSLAERSFLLGSIFHRLKVLNRSSGILWGVWAEKNLDFISKRNREKFMMLAKRTDCHRFSFLGVDRLEVLCSATKDSKEDDPIGKLLEQYQITFDEESEINLAEFKLSVDSALNNERLLRNGITVSPDLTKNLTQVGVEFDKSFLRKLKDIQECGGHPETYLSRLSINRGEESAESEGEIRLHDFNSLSNRLIKTIDYLIQEEDQLAKVDRTTLDLLLKKLLALQGTANLTQMDVAA